MTLRIALFVVLSTLAALYGASCTPSEPNELDKLGTVRLTINDQLFELWVADNSAERERGLMFITSDQMVDLPDGTKRGMVFAFDHEQPLAFWMRNTIIPLDIAYLDAGGVVVGIHTMAPLDDRFGQYPSLSPAQFAIEVNAGTWSDLGVHNGDQIDIASAALKGTP